MLPLKGQGVREELRLKRQGLQELVRFSLAFGAGAATVARIAAGATA